MTMRISRETALFAGVMALLFLGLVNHAIEAPESASSPTDSWERLVLATGFMLSGALLLFRASSFRGAGWVSASLLLLGMSEATMGAGNLPSIGLELLGCVGITLGLYGITLWPPELPDERRLYAWFPWPIGALDFIVRSARAFDASLVSGVSPEALVVTVDGLICVAFIYILGHNYHASPGSGRRRLRWITIGWILGFVPWLLWLAASALLGWSDRGWLYSIAYTSSALGPLGIVMAALADDAFEFDGETRVVVALTLGMAAVAWATYGAYLGVSISLEVSREAARWLDLLALALLAGALTLTYRWLRPPLLERFAPGPDLEQVHQTLSTCTSDAQIAEAVARALRPHPCAAYVLDLEAEAFVRVAGDAGAAALSDHELPESVWGLPARLHEADDALWAPIWVEDTMIAIFVTPSKPHTRQLLTDLSERATHAFERLRIHARLERQRQLVRQLRQDARARSEGDVAQLRHDIKEPLAALRLLGALLEERAQDADTRALAEQIHELSGSLHGLMDASISRHTGRVRLQHHGLQKIERELRLIFEPRAERLGLTLSIDLGDHQVHANEAFLTRILSNLLGNALRYTRPGDEVRVWSRCVPSTQVHIVVEDTGPGLEASEDAAEGHGLGLVIVGELAALIGAELTLESAPQEGTRATVALAPDP